MRCSYDNGLFVSFFCCPAQFSQHKRIGECIVVEPQVIIVVPICGSSLPRRVHTTVPIQVTITLDDMHIGPPLYNNLRSTIGTTVVGKPHIDGITFDRFLDEKIAQAPQRFLLAVMHGKQYGNMFHCIFVGTISILYFLH